MIVNAENQLRKQLDESLKAHAGKMNHQSIQSIYELQSLSEIHYYLKAEHSFTPAETEALLMFRDPLAAAQECWEENEHSASFPICELLEKSHAYERLERVQLPDASAYLTPEEKYRRAEQQTNEIILAEDCAEVTVYAANAPAGCSPAEKLENMLGMVGADVIDPDLFQHEHEPVMGM